VSVPAASRIAIRGRVVARALEPAVVAAVPGVVAAERPPEGPTLVLDESEHTGHALRTQPQGGLQALAEEANLPDYLAPGLAAACGRTSGAARPG
jgi:hypothetical protein